MACSRSPIAVPLEDLPPTPPTPTVTVAEGKIQVAMTKPDGLRKAVLPLTPSPIAVRPLPLRARRAAQSLPGAPCRASASAPATPVAPSAPAPATPPPTGSGRHTVRTRRCEAGRR